MVKIEQSNGTISITNEVFTNLAGDAATSCFGVKGMVGRSKDSGPFQLLRRESMSKGVNATFADDGSISLELHIAVDHGVNISALAHSIINEVSYKVNQAKEMLQSNMLIYEVCDKIGYENANYFAKLFRRYTGFTPGQYRRYPV